MARNGVYSNYVIRTATQAGPLVPGMEATLRGLDPDLVFLDTGTFQDLADVRLFPIRAGAWLIGVFGVFLAAFGFLLNKAKVVPVGDPRLIESLGHENF